MSHELKTPLTTIMGYAEIIGNGIARTEDIPEFAGKIRLEAARLLSLIEDIIKLSRLDENELTSRFEPVELAEVCRSVVKKLSDKAQKADVSLTFAGSPCVVNGIESILYEILFNLTDNAIIYNRKGGEVRLSLTEAGGRATVVVEDTGIGIAHEHIDASSSAFTAWIKAIRARRAARGLAVHRQARRAAARRFPQARKRAGGGYKSHADIQRRRARIAAYTKRLCGQTYPQSRFLYFALCLVPFRKRNAVAGPRRSHRGTQAAFVRPHMAGARNFAFFFAKHLDIPPHL